MLAGFWSRVGPSASARLPFRGRADRVRGGLATPLANAASKADHRAGPPIMNFTSSTSFPVVTAAATRRRGHRPPGLSAPDASSWRARGLALLGLLAGISSASAAAVPQWPQFRGPNSAGVAEQDKPPLACCYVTNVNVSYTRSSSTNTHFTVGYKTGDELNGEFNPALSKGGSYEKS